MQEAAAQPLHGGTGEYGAAYRPLLLATEQQSSSRYGARGLLPSCRRKPCLLNSTVRLGTDRCGGGADAQLDRPAARLSRATLALARRGGAVRLDPDGGERLWLVKWRGLSYDHCTWEDGTVAGAQHIEAFEKRKAVLSGRL